MNCKRCGKKLQEGEEYMCFDCRDVESSAATDVLNYLDACLPIPVSTCSECSEHYWDYQTRLYSRTIIFIVLDRILDDPFDDPCDVVLDLMIEIYNYEKAEEQEESLYKLDVYAATLSCLRHYLMDLGYGVMPRSRY